ncbi:MAG: hypothetical protein EAZ92_06100 [Candidatus Kapaibacterium sp.]|nr:MAG: hypothetical protein EAZ92_06100 [Candidatus Kapabacteria bacterium]
MYKLFFVLVVFALGGSSNLWSQSPQQADTTACIIDIPLVDVPYLGLAAQTVSNKAASELNALDFLSSYANPSMKQSLSLSGGIYGAGNWAIKKLISTNDEFLDILLRNSAAGLLGLAMFYAPGGNAWLHEEYHRAVMTRNLMNSFNEMNTFPFGREAVSVKNVRDEDLIRLKNTANTEFVRLMAAGIEGQYHQNQMLQKQNFFYRQDLPHIPLYWINTMSSMFYVLSSSSGEAMNGLIDRAHVREGRNIAERDFTGPDFTAWADALVNPEKRYEARGMHPSGVGIQRYVRPSDLSTEAREYLQTQGVLQFLNILSPHLVGFSAIRIDSTRDGIYYGNAALRHLLTPFGFDVALDIFFQAPDVNVFFSMHNYFNRNAYFVGIQTEVIDYPVFNGNALASVRAHLWVQPENQSFRTTTGQLGGLAGGRLVWLLGKNIQPFIDVEAKSAGWVMGNEFLGSNLGVSLGLRMMFR